MAKQRSNTGLIQGAAFAASGGSKTGGFVDSSAAIAKGFESSIKESRTRQAEQKAKTARNESRMASMVNKLNTNIDTAGLSTNQVNTIKDFVSRKRNEYVDIANQLSKMSPYDDNYADLTSQLNRVQASIGTAATNKNKYMETKGVFKETNPFMVSNGNQQAIDQSEAIFGDDSSFSINEDGGWMFGDVNLGNYELPPLKAVKAATDIGELAEQYSNANRVLTESDKELMKLRVTAVVANNKNTLSSLVKDGLLSDSVIKNIDPENIGDSNQVIDAIVDNMSDISSQAYNLKLKEKARKSTSTGKVPSLSANKIAKINSALAFFKEGKRIGQKTDDFYFEPKQVSGVVKYQLREKDETGEFETISFSDDTDTFFDEKEIENYLKYNIQ